MTYLLESGSDRIGALDFQRSPTEYVPRQANNVSLEELMESADHFLLSEKEALEIFQAQSQVIEENWQRICDEASLSEVDRNHLWG